MLLLLPDRFRTLPQGRLLAASRRSQNTGRGTRCLAGERSFGRGWSLASDDCAVHSNRLCRVPLGALLSGPSVQCSLPNFSVSSTYQLRPSQSVCAPSLGAPSSAVSWALFELRPVKIPHCGAMRTFGCNEAISLVIHPLTATANTREGKVGSGKWRLLAVQAGHCWPDCLIWLLAGCLGNFHSPAASSKPPSAQSFFSRPQQPNVIYTYCEQLQKWEQVWYLQDAAFG